MGLRTSLLRIRRRMDRWWWPFIVMMVPILFHEADHLVGSTAPKALFPVGSFDGWLAANWGWQAALWYHNILVFLGGLIILLFLWILATPELDKSSDRQAESESR